MVVDPKIVMTGIGIGILITAPCGPVNILVIQRTLGFGFWGGVAAGLGATIGDGLVAAIAAFGITAISAMLIEHKIAVQLIGSIILFGLGIKLLAARFDISSSEADRDGLSNNATVIPQTFLLTITNPGAVLGLIAIVGGIGSTVGGLDNYSGASALVIAIMAGSVIWWFGLSKLIMSIRHKLDQQRIRSINRLSGLIIMGFGLVIGAKLTVEYLL